MLRYMIVVTIAWLFVWPFALPAAIAQQGAGLIPAFDPQTNDSPSQSQSPHAHHQPDRQAGAMLPSTLRFAGDRNEAINQMGPQSEAVQPHVEQVSSQTLQMEVLDETRDQIRSGSQANQPSMNQLYQASTSQTPHSQTQRAQAPSNVVFTEARVAQSTNPASLAQQSYAKSAPSQPLRSASHASDNQHVAQVDPDAAWVRDIEQRIASQGSSQATQLPTAIGSGGAIANEDKSFIDREKEQETSESGKTTEMITRIGINLAVVLVMAVGFLLLVKNWQRGGGRKANRGLESELKVSQVLRLTSGASLHIVDGAGSRFMVAVDSTGIKSVNPLVSGSFSDAIDELDIIASIENRTGGETKNRADQRRESQSNEEPPRETMPRIVRDREETFDQGPTEIDQRLIEQLLRGSRSKKQTTGYARAS